jgi:hypothetical protein
MGGKRDLAPVVVEALGTGWTRYVEPCLGAGSVALAWSSATTTPPSCGRCWQIGGSCGLSRLRARSTATALGVVAWARSWLFLAPER